MGDVGRARACTEGVTDLTGPAWDHRGGTTEPQATETQTTETQTEERNADDRGKNRDGRGSLRVAGRLLAPGQIFIPLKKKDRDATIGFQSGRYFRMSSPQCGILQRLLFWFIRVHPG